MIAVDRQEELELLQSREGFIIHSCSGAMYFIDKFPTEHRPTCAWFKLEIEKRIRANATRFGHVLEDWMIVEIMSFAMKYLADRDSGSLQYVLTSLAYRRHTVGELLFHYKQRKVYLSDSSIDRTVLSVGRLESFKNFA